MDTTISAETARGTKSEVVIIGGGSGAVLARKLSSAALDFDKEQHNLTLITPRPFQIYLPAAARMLVTEEGHLEDTALIPYDRLYDEGNAGSLTHGKVARIVDGAVELTDGRSIKYTALVVATGTLWEGPLDFPDTEEGVREHLKIWRAKFAAAKSVAVIGGGAVGIEFATEIKHFYPATEVTLVHAQKLLLNDAYPDKFRIATTNRVKAFGIKVILDDKLELPAEGEKTGTTTNGVTVTADLFLPARGGRPNTDILKSLDVTCLNYNGTVKVLENLQIVQSNGKANVFAMGDIIDWPEQHMYAKVDAQSTTLTNNVLGAINHGITPSIPYPGSMEAILLAMGPSAGSGYIPKLWGLVFGDWVVSYVKSAGLFISQGRKALGY